MLFFCVLFQVKTAVMRKWQRYKIRRISRRHSRTLSTVLRIPAKSSSADQVFHASDFELEFSRLVHVGVTR